MIAVALPVIVGAIALGGGIAAQLTWPHTPGRHRMPQRDGRHRP